MTEVFDELTVMDDPVKEEDRVVYLLASLPEHYNVLVTALEASPEVPAFAVVTERLLHEESKMKNRSADSDQEGALIGKFKKRGRCHFCNRPGHFKRECEAYVKVKGQIKKRTKAGAFKVTISAEDTNSSDGEGTGLVVQHALTGDCNLRDRWILDSGATCHMCNSASQFANLQTLTDSLTVTLGDGHTLQVTGHGDVIQKEKVNKYVKLEVGENEPTIQEQGTPELTVSDVPNQNQHEVQVTHGSNTIDPPLKRSTRNRHEPFRYGYQFGFMASSEEHDPSTVREALSTPDKARWEEAMAREMESIHSNRVWELVEPPLNRKIVGSKWIFKQKRDAEGTVTQYKARLVAQGCIWT